MKQFENKKPQIPEPKMISFSYFPAPGVRYLENRNFVPDACRVAFLPSSIGFCFSLLSNLYKLNGGTS